ncbi:MAG TPA: hypothetical protein VKE70_23070 [Candidatus Solibacter sp.]|nr:hypothetical protein [Candidatus Solibacter sp.]
MRQDEWDEATREDAPGRPPDVRLAVKLLAGSVAFSFFPSV